MKLKRLLPFGLAVSLSMFSSATVRSPKDNIGNSLNTIDWVGVLPCAVTAATGTTALLCTSGRGVVFGVMMSSVPLLTDSKFMVLRDSATGNSTSSSFTAVGPQTNGTTQVLPGGTILQIFPRPIQFTNGLSENMTVAPQNNEIWTILYRPLAATE